MMFMGAVGPAYDPDAAAFFGRAQTASGAAPDSARRALYNDLIIALKTAGCWSLIDHIALLDAANLSTGLLDLKGNYNLVQVGSGTFTADRGLVPASSVGAINSGFTPSTNIASVSDFSLGIWTRGNVVPEPSVNVVAGVNDGTNYLQLIPLIDPDNKIVAAMNKTSGAAFRFGSTVSSLTSPFIVAQGDFNNTNVYLNGSLQTRSGSAAGVNGAPTRPIYFGGQNNNGTAQRHGDGLQVMTTLIGRNMNGTQQLALYNALHAYHVGVGAL